MKPEYDLANIAAFAGLSHGHGWFRTSDLLRVKRYVTTRENARCACKCVPSGLSARYRVLRSLRVFHGSSGHWSPPGGPFSPTAARSRAPARTRQAVARKGRVVRVLSPRKRASRAAPADLLLLVHHGRLLATGRPPAFRAT